MKLAVYTVEYSDEAAEFIVNIPESRIEEVKKADAKIRTGNIHVSTIYTHETDWIYRTEIQNLVFYFRYMNGRVYVVLIEHSKPMPNIVAGIEFECGHFTFTETQAAMKESCSGLQMAAESFDEWGGYSKINLDKVIGSMYFNRLDLIRIGQNLRRTMYRPAEAVGFQYHALWDQTAQWFEPYGTYSPRQDRQFEIRLRVAPEVFRVYNSEFDHAINSSDYQSHSEPTQPNELARQTEFDEVWLGTMYELQLSALLSDELVSTIESSPQSENKHLSPRERECLLWAARGKSAWETGTIIGTSERAVRFHFENVLNKLGVNSKIHAVVKAILTGEIVP